MKPDEKACAALLVLFILTGASLIAFNLWRIHNIETACLEARGSMVDDGCRFEVHP